MKKNNVGLTRVFMICHAYESGYGHGFNADGKNDSYYSDPDLNEAYQYGYEQGLENRKEMEETERSGLLN